MSYEPSEFLSYGKQWIDDEDVAAVVRTLKGEYLTQGPAIQEFEEAIRAATGAKYCVAVSNGTAALHLAVAALELPAGCRGITTPITFAASANCMLYCGVSPAFADIDEDTLCVDPAAIEASAAQDARLLIPVHFGGAPADMERIGAIGRSRGMRVIEDAAHAIGTRYPDGSRVGSCAHSDMTTFSFHPVKTITTGEGGAITTNDESLYRKLFLLRTHGITKDPAMLSGNPGPWYYEMQALGFNYRLTDVQAALGVSQMKKLGSFSERRREIVKAYEEAFEDIPWIKMQRELPGAVSARHLFVIQVDFDAIGKDRASVMRQLASKGVGTQVHYIPVNTLPYYRETLGYSPDDTPKAMRYYKRALSIPLYPKMGDADVRYVIDRIAELGA